MKQRPILFSTPMVQAILTGEKTVTRRVIKHKHQIEDVRPVMRCDQNEKDWGKFVLTDENGEDFLIKPRYQIGDVLWVRETFGQVSEDGYVYRADQPDGNHPIIQWKWKPSLFMPREAARIFLEVTNVKVERLQDITEADAMSEGVELNIRGWKRYLSNNPGIKNTAKQSFASLWETLHGEGSWKLNPFVWVYEFKNVTL